MTPGPCKFQAFVTVSSPEADGPAGQPALASATLPPGQIRRLGLRGEHHPTRGIHFFSALVANNADSSDWIGDNHAIVTVTLTSDDAAEYFSAGDHFAPWIGHDIADGVVTRWLFAWTPMTTALRMNPYDDQPGDAPCLLRRVCPECGSVADCAPPTTCSQCGASLPAD